MTTPPSDAPKPTRPRWYAPTPAKSPLGVFVGVILFSVSWLAFPLRGRCEEANDSVVDFDTANRPRVGALLKNLTVGNLLPPIEAWKGKSIRVVRGKKSFTFAAEEAYLSRNGDDETELIGHVMLRSNTMSKADALVLLKKLRDFIPEQATSSDARIDAWTRSEGKERLIINSTVDSKSRLYMSIEVMNSFAVDEGKPWVVDLTVGWEP